MNFSINDISPHINFSITTVSDEIHFEIKPAPIYKLEVTERIGRDGASAYEVWLNSHTGSEEDFLEWLKSDVDLSSVANIDASNLSSENINDWKSKLNINAEFPTGNEGDVLVKGATEWEASSRLTDVENEVNQLQSELGTLQTNVNNLPIGALTDTALFGIKQQKNIVQSEYQDVYSRYVIIRDDAFLTDKTALNNAYGTASTGYLKAYNDLIAYFDTAFNDNAITQAEKDELNNRFTAYKTALGTFATQMQTAVKTIEQNKIDNIKIGGKNLLVNGDFEKGLTGWSVSGAGLAHVTTDYILSVPFNNSITDVSGINTMIAGNGSNSPTFGAGRKGSDVAAIFNGSQSIKTTTNLPINSDKVSIAFWMKTTQTGAAIVAELSRNAFAVAINDSLANRVSIIDYTSSGYNIGNSSININNGNWFHVVMTIDRNLGASQNQIYINGSLSYMQHATLVNDLVGNFANNILFIGQRTGSSLGFNGSLQNLKIYNRVLSASEIMDLYYE